jgi:hypothetical protein
MRWENEAMHRPHLEMYLRGVSCDFLHTAPPGPIPSRDANLWRREGDYWTIAYHGTTSRLRHSKGFAYLAELLRLPGREIHALELVALAQGGRPPSTADFAFACDLDPTGLGDAGETLDLKARAAYRGRLREIDAEQAEAEGHNDLGRLDRLHREREALEAELGGGVGLGGRARRAASAAERARLNVTRAIKSAILRIDATDPDLAGHLIRRVRTGTFCLYLPDPRAAVSWTVEA